MTTREYLEFKTSLNMSNEDDINFVLSMLKKVFNLELTRDDLLKDDNMYLDYIRNLPEEEYFVYVEYLKDRMEEEDYNRWIQYLKNKKP